MTRPAQPYEFDTDWLGCLIRAQFERAFSGLLPDIGDVKIQAPSPEQFVEALNSNGQLQTDRGHISLIPQEKSLTHLELDIPMPVNGIFLFNGVEEDLLWEKEKSSLWSWCPWIAESRGPRLVRNNSTPQKLSLRIGSGGPDYGHFPATNERGNPVTAHFFEKHMRLPESRIRISQQKHLSLVDRLFWVETSHFVCGPSGLNYGANKSTLFDELTSSLTPDVDIAVQAIRENLAEISESLNPSDLDDLEHRMVMTFPFWLSSRITESIWRVVVFDHLQIGKQRTNVDCWNTLTARSRKVQSLVFPRARLIKQGCLKLFNPRNPIDAISQLTELKRYGTYEFPSPFFGVLPPAYHQNHPSFDGRICPVETTEAENVGISLHLAKGVVINDQGQIVPCAAEAHGLGWAASLIPFYEHNDAVRNMMGAKNLKQACPIQGRKKPEVSTGEENDILQALRPLTRMGLISKTEDKELAPGVDLLVAFMPYRGLNFEDAIVANSRLRDEGLLNFEEKEKRTQRIRPGLSQTPMKTGPLDAPDETTNSFLCATPGTELHHNDVLARFWDTKTGEAEHIRYLDHASARLEDISLKHDPAFGGRLKLTLTKRYTLEAGDKLMGRHGNKGVISALLPDNEMPRLPYSDDLPEAFRGRAVDLVLNPNGVISRMNMGQLIETHVGWLKHTLPQKEQTEIEPRCHAFAQEFSSFRDKISEALDKSGFDKHGKIKLTLPGGEQTAAPVVVGFQHIVRLRHIPSLKAQSRGRHSHAVYDLRTGQAVRGRRIGGGQRIGELEMWALAAHQTPHLIDEFLRLKSDHASITKYPLKQTSTWESIRDHLFAVGISLTSSPEKGVQFDFAPLDTTKIWSTGAITGRHDTVQGHRSIFQCPKCDYRAVEEPVFHKEEYVTLEAVLNAMGLQCPDKPAEWTDDGVNDKGFKLGHGIWKLRYIGTRRSCVAAVSCVERKTDLSITMVFPKRKTQTNCTLTAIGRKPGVGGRGKEGKQGFTLLSIAGLSDKENELPLGSLRVTCSKLHASESGQLRPAGENHLPCRWAVNDGIFSPVIFGEIDELESSEPKWGHIELPERVKFPDELFEFTLSKPRRIRYVPVLPLRYRRPTMSGSRDKPKLSINKKYRTLLDHCRKMVSLRKSFGTNSPQYKKERPDLVDKVKAVFQECLLVIEGSIPKKGLFRRHGLGRRVDCSGRLVIVPDPDIQPSCCKVPVPILWDLLSADIVTWLNEAEDFFSEKQSGRLTTAEAFEAALKQLPEELTGAGDFGARWFAIRQKQILESSAAERISGKTIRPGEGEDICRRTLSAYLDHYSEKLILLNRSPTLHKYGLLAFRPEPVSMKDGMVLRISPLVCGMYAADFDGDEMSLHWPLSQAAHEDARRLLPQNNLISEASGKPTLHYAQDIVLGIYLLQKTDKTSILYDILAKHIDDPVCCNAVLPKNAWNKEVGLQLVTHLCMDHPKQAEALIHDISKAAFEAATIAGISFGIFDLLDMQMDATRIENLSKKIRNTLTKEGKDAKDVLHKEVDSALKQKASEGIHSPGFGFAALADSGARGGKTVSQIIAARGLLDPGSLGFHSRPERYFFSHNLLSGCKREVYFDTVYNARSSICDKKLGTAQSGGLTRQLVGLMWDIAITEEDCQTSGERNPINCQAVGGICAACYGYQVASKPKGKHKHYPIGYPAGLLAAQSIGERGTQLSMQSFHTGEKAFTPSDVSALLTAKGSYLIEDFFFTPSKQLHTLINPESRDKLQQYLDPLYRQGEQFRSLHDQLYSANQKERSTILRKLKKLPVDFIQDEDTRNQLERILGHAFVYLFLSIGAYSDLLARHIQLLWRARHDHLREIKPPLPPLAAMAYYPIRPRMLWSAEYRVIDPMTHPASRIVAGTWLEEK